MMTRRTLALLLLVPFSLVTLYALVEVGYLGVVRELLDGPASWQIALDLVVALVLVLSWMIGDARRHGRNPWPYVVLTLAMGSFGPLAYLLLSPSPAGASAETA